MRNKGRSVVLRGLLENARYEVLPTPSIEDTVLEHLPPGFTVTVTASQSKGLEATLDLAARLSAQGYDVVPHVAARMVSGRSELAEICARLVPLGVSTVFVPAGDADPPAGDYKASLDLLEDLSDLGRPFAHVGITGYPETHPSIDDDLTIQAMWDKRRHATHVVSNLTFDPGTLNTWLVRMRARGVTLPLLVGLPGPVERTKLLAMATKIGVGESTKFLVKNKGTLTRLAAPGGFTGERFLEKSAAVLARPESQVTGLHVFTFNAVAATERWRQDLLQRLGGPVTTPG
ncbi:MAG: methylenetetrahydrofolate reductase [Actinomycetota bacterium]|nr:methylenetetrahydrofolate reductase [Actinomycetota bacterium]